MKVLCNSAAPPRGMEPSPAFPSSSPLKPKRSVRRHPHRRAQRIRMPAAQRAPVVSIILCVDDEVTPLTIRKCVLEKAGFHVITAGSAKDALEILRTTNIDLVVSD